MERFDFTPTNGKNLRPSAARILSAWKNAGKPSAFRVDYGDANIEFTQYRPNRWDAYGYSGRIKVDAVIKGLEDESKEAASAW